MVVIAINMTAEDHSHDQVAVRDRQPFAIKKQASQHIEIRHADADQSSWHQYAAPLSQRLQQLLVVIKMLDDVRSVDLIEGTLGEGCQIAGILEMIHRGARQDVENFPALHADLSADVQLSSHRSPANGMDGGTIAQPEAWDFYQICHQDFFTSASEERTAPG